MPSYAPADIRTSAYTVRMGEKMRDVIEDMALHEQRSLNNMTVILLQEALAARKAKAKQ
jgi:hypothetical protein